MKNKSYKKCLWQMVTKNLTANPPYINKSSVEGISVIGLLIG